MAEVNLPVVGGVSKKALVIGGIGSAAVVALIYLRKRNSAASSAAGSTGPADTTGTDTSGDYTDPGLQDTSQGPTYGQTGYYDPNTGQWVYGATGTGQAAATTNAAWARMAEQYLIENASGDPAAVSAALGKYLTGQAVTGDQESLIDQAIAVEGYPPQGGPGGYPPGIRTQASGGQGGGGGGGGGGAHNVTVPKTAGGTAGTAHDKIAAAGLVPVADPGQKATWIVTSTTPAAGHAVPRGTRVLITASAKKRK